MVSKGSPRDCEIARSCVGCWKKVVSDCGAGLCGGRTRNPSSAGRRKRRRWLPFVPGLLVVVAGVGVPAAEALDPGSRAQEQLETAAEWVKAGEHELARAYLDDLVSSPWITARQRARAFYLRGYGYAEAGLHVSARHDYRRAVEFHPNHSASLMALAHLHDGGLGVPRNPFQAFRLALKAARGGDAMACLFVGIAYQDGRGTEVDRDRARHWLRQAAVEHGVVEAFAAYGRSFRVKFADEPDPIQARHWYEKAAAAGDDGARLAIAFMVRDGEFGEADAQGAAARFRVLADEGNAVAQSALAHILLGDAGVEVDYEQAFSLYSAAAEAGERSAYAGLAFLFRHGFGTQASAEREEHWLRRAADAGHADSQYRLGRLVHARGEEDEGVVAEALGWLDSAADRGVFEAAHVAAWIYATTRHDALRDPHRALALAESAVLRRRDADTLDTLAAAKAAQGDFEGAVATQRLALSLAAADAELLAHLEAYQGGRAWVE